MRILFVEVEERLTVQITSILNVLDYVIDVVDDAEIALEALRTKEFDILIFSDSLEQPPALDVMTEYLNSGGSTPILFLVQKENMQDGIVALNKGADDFVCKPIHVQEFVARVRALARRSRNYESSVIEFGPLQFDFDSRSVWLDGKLLELTRRDKAVLEVLLKRAGKYASKEYIASYLYTINVDVNIRTIETYIYRLRSRLKHPELNIKTVWGSGYTIELLDDQTLPEPEKKIINLH